MAQKPNQHPGTCKECGESVAPGAGYLAGKVYSERAGRQVFAVKHNVCPDQPASSNQGRASSFAPTAEQQVCIEKFLTGKDLVIQAGAGAGKTSTLILLAKEAQKLGKTGQYTAFNRSIVFDSRPKFAGTDCKADTAHSLAWGDIGKEFKGRLDKKTGRVRPRELADLLRIESISVQLSTGETRQLAAGFLAGLAVQAVAAFCASTDPELRQKHIPYIDGIDVDNEDGTHTWARNNLVRKALFPAVKRAWDDLSNPSGRLPVTQSTIHKVYFKLWALNHPVIQADYILYDEAQDADPVTLQVLEAQRERGVQLVAVGDSQQEIYGWRGAVDALAKFEKLGAEVAFLTKSFRFGDAVAEVANKLLTKLDAPLRIQGFEKLDSSIGEVDEPDVVLTRTNAGAVRALIEQLDKGRVPYLQGGVGELLAFAYAARDIQNHRTPVEHPDLTIFTDWNEVKQYVDDEPSAADLKLWVQLIDDFGVDSIINNLKRAGDERTADVVISTAHKSKGREWATVKIGPDFKAPKEGELSAGELRLAYVAVTRAKTRLDIESAQHFVRANGSRTYNDEEI